MCTPLPLSIRALALVLYDITNNPELNVGRGKRIAKSNMGLDVTMEDAVGEKRSGRGEGQFELLKRRRVVSQVDEATKRILVEVGSQLCQDQ